MKHKRFIKIKLQSSILTTGHFSDGKLEGVSNTD